MKRQPLVAVVVGLELALLAGLAWLWITGHPANPLSAPAFGLQPWVPYAAVGYGIVTLLALGRWASLPADTARSRRLGLGLLVIAMLAFGAYAFWELYIQVQARPISPMRLP